LTAEGGSVGIKAGDASFDGSNHLSGMIGGMITIDAGSSDGHSESDNGGNVMVSAGAANMGEGGSVGIKSGGSNYDSSGSVTIGSSDSGEYGPSGSLSLYTGDVTIPKRTTSEGDDSGSISISTGTSKHGFGGDIKLASGDGFGDFVNNDLGGGSISLLAGDTTGHANAAGSVNIMSGWG
jgi:hypothetical protein